MGKITFLVEGTTVGKVAEGKGVKVEYQVSEQDSARLIAAMAEFHKANLSGLTDADGNPREPGIDDICKAWFDSAVNTALRQTKDYEMRKAAVADINVTTI